MTIEEIKLRIEEAIYEYEKVDINNFYYDNIKDLKWVLGMLNNLDDNKVNHLGQNIDVLVY